ncbi:MAG TPA: asparagine synthase (glutamine-hydrolyzing), partial [Thermoanaerobaculia bacterium]|nr:asparagine synthase (glutamine-hydrolyzing) [Thermoanaerobaculia bacterium]
HAFHSDTDTEVILAAYARWGRSAVERLRGMFAFALWDASEQRMFLARDRFGIKPLFLARDGASIAFASEIKALVAAGAPFRPSATASAAYLALGRLPVASGGPTFFEGIEAAHAAHAITVTRDSIEATRYWQLPEPGGLKPAAPRDVLAQYADVLTDALRIHLRADVPIGTCLSGGLDSSSIVALAGKLMRDEHPAALERMGAHQQTFSAVYEDDGVWNERKHIDRVIAATGAAPNFVIPTREQLLRDLDALVWHQDEPFTTTSMFAQWCVMRLARQRGVTVLLDGQGADEVLGGYHSIYGPHLRDLVRRGRLVAALREARGARNVAGIAGERLLLNELVRPALAPSLRRRRAHAFEERIASSALTPSAAALLRDAWNDGAMREMQTDHAGADDYLRFAVTSDPLPNLLHYEDRNSMAFSIEGRVPFLDHVLVEFVFRHAGAFRVHDGWTKWLQRVTIDPLLPREIAWRRDKVGFDTPQGSWMRDLGPVFDDAIAAAPAVADFGDVSRIRRETDPSRRWRWLC